MIFSRNDSRPALATAALSLLVAFGCSSTPTVPVLPDAGADALVDAALPKDSCDPSMIQAVEGVLNDTVTVNIDTSEVDALPRDLGPACGNPSSELRWAPQKIIAFKVPGTGRVGVQIDTRTAGTAVNFNTVLQIRRSPCNEVPSAQALRPSCFDDASDTELRAAGGTPAMGGETLYIVVTGYSDPPASQRSVERGPVQLAITTKTNTAPVVDEAKVIFSLADVLVRATATDAESPTPHFALSLFTASAQVDLDNDGQITDGDVLLNDFATVDHTGTTTSGTFRFDGTMIGLAAYCRQVSCTRAGIVVFDENYEESNRFMLNIVEAETVGVGAACDPEHICAGGLSCTAGICAVTPGATAVCATATPIALETPTTVSTQATGTASIGAGAGSFGNSCVNAQGTQGKEAPFTIVIPEGTFDLTLTTLLPANMTIDTLLSLRSSCVDGSTEVAMSCKDDDSMSETRTTVKLQNVAPGTYTAMVEVYGGVESGTRSVALSATLIPVLATGAACDMAQVQNRCANGACAAGLCP